MLYFTIFYIIRWSVVTMDNDQIINTVNVPGGEMIIGIDWAGYAWPPKIDKLNFKHFVCAN